VPRFIEVDQPHAVSVDAVVQAAKEVEATYVVVTFGEDAPEILPVAGLEAGDDAPIADRAGDRMRVTDVTTALAARPTRVFHGLRVVVVFSGDQPLVVEADEPPRAGPDEPPTAERDEPLDSERIGRLIDTNRIAAFAADTTLPGKPGTLPDPIVVYTCENGHNVPQRRSNPNRTCPFCDARLEA
jgi:hypothetical protein